MTGVEFVSEQPNKKTPLRRKTDQKQTWTKESRALSTIEELSEPEVSESEVEDFVQENLKYVPCKNPCIVTIGTLDIIETVKISGENSPVEATAAWEEQVEDRNNVNTSGWFGWVGEWRQQFSIDQCLFSLFLGLIPTAWDVFSDLRFGADLASTNEISAAGCNF